QNNTGLFTAQPPVASITTRRYDERWTPSLARVPPRLSTRSRRRTCLRQTPCKLRARLDAEFAEHLVQVVLDCAWADEQLCGDLPVRVSLRHEAGDLHLLRSELVACVHGPFPGAFACRQHFPFGASRERLGAHLGE